MTQIDPRRHTTTPNPSPGGPQRKQEPPFNWRVSVGMAIGLLVLFGVLFGLRALDIFPPKPGEIRRSQAFAPRWQLFPRSKQPQWRCRHRLRLRRQSRHR